MLHTPLLLYASGHTISSLAVGYCMLHALHLPVPPDKCVGRILIVACEH